MERVGWPCLHQPPVHRDQRLHRRDRAGRRSPVLVRRAPGRTVGVRHGRDRPGCRTRGCPPRTLSLGPGHAWAPRSGLPRRPHSPCRGGSGLQRNADTERSDRLISRGEKVAPSGKLKGPAQRRERAQKNPHPWIGADSVTAGRSSKVRPKGFEPLTFCSVDRRSIQLSYGRILGSVEAFALFRTSNYFTRGGPGVPNRNICNTGD